MRKLKLMAAAALCVAAVGCSPRGEVTANYSVVPLPQQITAGEGEGFVLDSGTRIAYPEGDSALMRDAELLAQYIGQMTGLNPELTTETDAKGVIALAAGLQSENAEAYQLTVTPEGISIDGATPAGTFYGVQTLRKAIPEAGKNNRSEEHTSELQSPY